MKRKGKYPNITDVAKEAKVSIATVSRVINNLPSVKEVNRAKVLKVIDKLNFRPNISARRLASNSVNSIGIIWPFYNDMLGSYFFIELMKGIRGVVFGGRRDIVLLYNINETEDEFYRRILNNTYIGGLILELGALEINPILKKSDIPFIIVNAHHKDPKINCISMDNTQGAYLAVKHLIETGHRRVAIIHGALGIQPGIDRLTGYEMALKEYGLDIDEGLIADGNFSRQTAYEKMLKLLEIESVPTAIFIASDEMAIGAAKAIREKGLEIPRDISIVGFDDSPIASEFSPPLTTVRQPIAKMGSHAAQTLIKIITKQIKGGVKETLKTELIIRDSSFSMLEKQQNEV